MITFLKKLIFGTAIPQEYLCLGLDTFSSPIAVFLTSAEGNPSVDVTEKHIFLGYKPLIMANIYDSKVKEDTGCNEIVLHFNQQAFHADALWKNVVSDSQSVARLSLKKMEIKKPGHLPVVFYTGTDGWHNLIPRMNQKMMSFIERKKNKPVNNVDLDINLYEQVRIAYSVPRIISLISVYDGKLMNLFPTDLHGSIDGKFYTSSLRIGGKACRQVEQNKRIVISEIDAFQFKESYKLGKRHMMEMDLPSNFKLHQDVSATFKFPLPFGVGLYRELEWTDYFDAGLHRVFIYKVVHVHKIATISTLAHIHRYYAQWRMDRGLDTSYLLR